jgi:hypothetical protein
MTAAKLGEIVGEGRPPAAPARARRPEKPCAGEGKRALMLLACACVMVFATGPPAAARVGGVGFGPA